MFKKIICVSQLGVVLKYSSKISSHVWGAADDQERQHVTICLNYVSDDYIATSRDISLSTFLYLWNIP